EASKEATEWSRLTMEAEVLWSLGRRAESDAALNRLIAADAEVAAFQIAQVHAHRGDNDHAFEWLERAYRQRDSGLAWLKSDRIFGKLASDGRWNEFLRKLGLADEQLRSLPPFGA
ncbi:MAG: hypothetical protein ACM3X5_09195, partial [Bacillota bacterium]